MKRKYINDLNLERHILSLIFRDEESLSLIISSNLLDSAHFSDKTLRRMFNVLKNYYIKYYKLPTKKTIRVKLYKNIRKEERVKYNNLLDKFYKIKLDGIKENFNIILEELEELKKARKIQTNIIDIARSFQRSDYKRGIDLYINSREDAIVNTEIDEGEYTEDYSERRDKVEELIQNPELKGFVKCTIPILKGESIYTADIVNMGKEIFNGGLWPGELTIVVGNSGTGKSMFLQNFGVNSTFHGSNVVVFTIEMMKHKLQTRIDTQITGIPFWKFRMGRLNDKELSLWQKRIEIFKNKCGRYYVVGFPKGCTVNMIEAKLLQLKKIMNIDLVTIDYMNDMSPSGRTRFATPQDWQAQGEISWDLAQLSKYWNDKKGIHIMTANQGKKGSGDKEVLTEEDVAFSPQPYRHATSVLTITKKVSKEKSFKYLVLYVSKNRDGEDGGRYFMLPNFEKCKVSVRPKWEDEDF